MESKTMDSEIEDRFEEWWKKEYANSDGTLDKEVYGFLYTIAKSSWMNGSYVREVEMIKERIQNES